MKKPLYLSRPILNPEDLLAYAREQGVPNLVPAEELHATVCYSKEPVDWDALGRNLSDVVLIEEGATLTPMGDGALALQFQSDALQERWKQVIAAGGSHDYPTYRPHVTVSVDVQGLEFWDARGYGGAIVLGPERFVDLSDKLAKEFDPDQPRDEDGKWTGGAGGSLGSSSDAIESSVPSKLARADVSRVNSYVERGHEGLNRGLRDIARGSMTSDHPSIASHRESLIKDAEELDKIIGRSPPLKEDIVVHRGLNLKSTESEGEVYSRGQVLNSPGFMSTTIDPDVASSFSGRGKNKVMMNIRVPAGTRVLSTSKVTGRKLDEKELLLPRNGRLEVVDFNPKTRVLTATYRSSR